MKKTVWLLVCFVSFATAQNKNASISGIVIDEANNSIPYVTIVGDNEEIITNSETDGSFKITVWKSQNLIFSAVGFETKTVAINKAEKVELKKVIFELNEVVIKPVKKSRTVIGKFEGTARINQSGGLTGKAFPFSDEMKKHPFLESVTFFSESEINEAKLNIMIKALNPDGSPGENLVAENQIITVKKGSKNTVVDFRHLNLEIPENGIFVCIETLKIAENKLSRDYKYQDEKGVVHEMKSVIYQPTFSFLPSKENKTWFYENGKWVRHSVYILENPKKFYNVLMKKYHQKYLDLPISLTITN